MIDFAKVCFVIGQLTALCAATFMVATVLRGTRIQKSEESNGDALQLHLKRSIESQLLKSLREMRSKIFFLGAIYFFSVSVSFCAFLYLAIFIWELPIEPWSY